MMELPIEEILRCEALHPEPAGVEIGRSRAGRRIIAHDLGQGALRVSLIAGCHADEPVGPAVLARLVRFLSTAGPSSPLLDGIRWLIVPHVNPDGAERNAAWGERTLKVEDHRHRRDRGYDPVGYLSGVVRETPGDDIEFGFPRHPEDGQARPENRAVGSFLAAAAPFQLHASFHGMGFAPGPWFLLEASWIDRTREMRWALRERVRSMGYALFDVDRQGEKGFCYIEEGFSTRPDSRAMAAYFLQRGDPATAAKFRPSSMEYVRRFGGDPLTVVSEMPLFLTPTEDQDPAVVFRPGTEGRQELHRSLQRLVAEHSVEEAGRRIAALGIRPMPIGDQMRLQLELLSAALRCVHADGAA